MAINNLTELKKLLKSKEIIIGTERTLKSVKLAKLSHIFLSANCPEDVIEDITHYAKLTSVKVIKLNVPNDELGVVCKKPYSISVLGIVK
ncbi:MAG: ribosomal L7Ae/L30e/S12e/Gadd45 family protein [Nanoarchaeota archaeon]